MDFFRLSYCADSVCQSEKLMMRNIFIPFPVSNTVIFDYQPETGILYEHILKQVKYGNYQLIPEKTNPLLDVNFIH